uniref:BCL2/adenovirus E1B 19 kDa protein-interacting protein 3 n=1 Tax=Phlebotomus papatasi TaxID=29031 RepID=A0A1B0GNX0_PHLPP
MGHTMMKCSNNTFFCTLCIETDFEINSHQGKSWIELNSNGSGTNSGHRSPERITPLPFTSGEEYLRLLREAQRESKESSRVVSLAGSRRDSPRSSPKSPPNSPNTELCMDDLKGVYINYWNSVKHPQRRAQGYSVRLARVGKNSLFSKEVLYSLLLTNVLSLILGAGFGMWLSKRGILLTRVSIE